MTPEESQALMESARYHSCEKYFEYRPHLVHLANQRLFEAAFERGWNEREKIKPPELAEWEKLKDPNTLHINLLRGFPAQLSETHLRHLLGNSVPGRITKALRKLADYYVKSHAHSFEIEEMVKEAYDALEQTNEKLMNL